MSDNTVILLSRRDTMTFSEIWEDYASFKADYDALIIGFADNTAPLTENCLKSTFYLLYARYGNNPIANSDIGQFKMKILANIYAYGPTWERKQKIQDTLRKLSESDLLIGAKQIYNHALNPSSEPSTSSLTELTYINDQNTANHKKSKMEAYSILWNLLNADSTREYIDKFKKCFAVFVDKMGTAFYIVRDDDFVIEEDE